MPVTTGAPALLALRGTFVVVGKQPDGDSVRFAPDTPALLDELRRGYRVDRSADGTVQLRLEGIDAPETHYGGQAQPLGGTGRDLLLGHLGFRDVRRDAETVLAATPETVPGAILTELADANGRPVCFAFAGEALPADGAWTPVDAERVARSANAALLAAGAAFLTLYDSCAAPVRRDLRAVAAEAREGGLGVWAADRSGAFALRDQADIGPDGALILPKLFRRCTDYLRTRAAGETLVHWLTEGAGAAREQDDLVIAGRGGPVRLSSLLAEQGTQIELRAALLDLVFVER
jgi:endonuclease YncB( thermonuclease family)